MNSFADEGLIQDFLSESREHLDEIEPDLLLMEEEGANTSQETINRVFRAIHSIKGGAGFLAFENLKRLSHGMENILMLVRDGKLAVTPALMDVLLRGVDKLRAMIADIHASDTVPCEDEIARLSQILQGASPAAATPGKGTVAASATEGFAILREFEFNRDALRAALAGGAYLYRVRVHRAEDLRARGLSMRDLVANMESVGQWLAASDDVLAFDQADGADPEITFLYATVLEEDLVSTALELPPSQIVALDTAAIKKELLGKEREPATGRDPLEQMSASPETDGAQEHQPIGEILVELGAATPAIIDEALRIQQSQTAAALHAGAAKGKPKAEMSETLRVRVDLLTRLMNMAGELVLGRNQLLQALENHVERIPGLGVILQNVDHITTELQEGIMQTRMQPMGSLFSRFPRLIRDMARNLGKEIDLQAEGAEVELDKSIIELLSDPLTHIVRNCVDHAIEPPTEREAAGKRRCGRVLLRAYHKGGQVNISISDDGRGLNTQRILQKAVEKGIVQPADAKKMKERDIVNLIFAPGLSTAETVSEVSGRGVGMDVVRTNIEKLSGHIDVETAANQGTTVLLRLPLTLAIIPSLIVGASGQRFAVPQVNLVELLRVRAGEVARRVEMVHGSAVLRLRGRLLPLVRLCDVLGMERTFLSPAAEEVLSNRRLRIADRRSPVTDGAENAPSGDTGDNVTPRRDQDRRQSWHGDFSILVLHVAANPFGVIVDELFDTEEIVVKPLSSFIKQCTCFAGSTILGDGRVVMILDVGGLAEKAKLRFSDLEAEEKRRREQEAQRPAIQRHSIILFNSAPDEFFAVPQNAVLRLERIPVSAIEHFGARRFVQYRGAGLPLIRLDECLPVKPLPASADELFLIIPKRREQDADTGSLAGILASSIVDALDVEATLQTSMVAGPGVQGSAIVNDRITIFLDPAELINAVHAGGGFLPSSRRPEEALGHETIRDVHTG